MTGPKHVNIYFVIDTYIQKERDSHSSIQTMQQVGRWRE